MNYLIITSHPYNGSFHAGLAQAIEDRVTQLGHKASHINLVEDGFDPVMLSSDLRAWGQAQWVDPLVEKYQHAIDTHDVLVFPFPVWWGNLPAVLKGFCDKVLLPDWAYKHGEQGELIGLLTNKKAIVITTMETPLAVFDTHYRNPIDGAFIRDTLITCGIEVLSHFQIDHIVTGGRPHAEQKMKEVLALFE